MSLEYNGVSCLYDRFFFSKVPMQIHHSLLDLQLPASVCAIGLFDGVHVGHRLVLENALKQASMLQLPSVVFSFADHPQLLTSQTPTPMLSDLDERLHLFSQMGFDHAFIPPFDEHMMNISAQDFIENILCDKLHVKSVTVGYDHRFGKNRLGDGSLLKSEGLERGFSVQIIDPVRISDDRFSKTPLNDPQGPIVSSTLIRKLLSYGEIALANRLLGYEYSIKGDVVSGLQRGRLLGFPTANLEINHRRLIPANGTYSGTATIVSRIDEMAFGTRSEYRRDANVGKATCGVEEHSNKVPDSQIINSGNDKMQDGRSFKAVCNIGLSPTFGDQAQKRVEVHLLEYSGSDFYGERLQFSFERKLRDECKFESKEALIHQIQQDCEQALLSPKLQERGLHSTSYSSIPTESA
jgi:riboflavin kinase / FMN adenylyltransferase